MNSTPNNIEPIKEKLDDKIKKLNSSRVIKKVTPKGDLSWYVKWISVFLILFATVARSVGTLPQVDMWFGLFGTLGWAYVGYLWHDRALLVLNSILVTTTFTFTSYTNTRIATIATS